MQELQRAFAELATETKEKIDILDISKKSHIQRWIYFFHFPVASVTESVLILCQSGKFNAAKILLRTLFESHIKIVYPQLVDTELRLSVAAREAFEEKLKTIHGIQMLIQRFPNLESDDPTNLFNKSWLKTAEDWAESRKSEIQASEKAPTLEEMTKRCDQWVVKNTEPGHFGRMYEVIYRQLSSSTHMSIDGIHDYITQDQTGKYLFGDGDDNLRLAAEAAQIYVALIKDLYENEVLMGVVPPSVHRLEKAAEALYG